MEIFAKKIFILAKCLSPRHPPLEAVTRYIPFALGRRMLTVKEILRKDPCTRLTTHARASECI